MWNLYKYVTRGILLILMILTCIYLLLPTLIVIPISFSSEKYLTFPPQAFSFQWYEKLWVTQGYFQSFWNSIFIGIVSAFLAMILGTCASLAVSRGNLAFSRSFSALVLAPMMLPQVILAIGLLPVLGMINMLGGYVGVIIAHTIIGIPLVMITVSANLRIVGPNFELAAMTMGANWLQTFWMVTFPIIRPGMFVGGLFAFAASFDEVIMAMFLTDGVSITLPKYMFGEMRYQLDPTIAAASTVVVTISLMLLATSGFIQKKIQSAKLGYNND